MNDELSAPPRHEQDAPAGAAMHTLAIEDSSEERSLGPFWLYASLVLVGVALVLHEPYLVCIGLTLVLVLLAAGLWGRYGFTRLSYRRTVEPAAAFHGDEIELVLRVANRKVLPLPWLSIEEELPAAVRAIGAATVSSHLSQRVLLAVGVDLAPYQAVTRRYRLRCTARGYHQIGPSALRTGDLFGLVRRRVTLDARDHLVVYPRIVELEALGLSASHPLGQAPAARRLYEDPTLLCGSRDYAPGDSLRRMHWKATARLGSLQVKVFDPSATLDVMIALDVATSEAVRWSYDAALLELGICAAASLAYSYLEERRAVGLLTNGVVAGYSGGTLAGGSRLLPGRTPGQLQAILDTLARLSPWSRGALTDLLAADLGALPSGATLAVITAQLTSNLAEALLAYRGAGYAIAVLLLGDAPEGGALAPTLPGVSIHYLGGARRWHELQALAVSPLWGSSPVPSVAPDGRGSTASGGKGADAGDARRGAHP
jgi:uncharacterized protein (DUF58 family)